MLILKIISDFELVASFWEEQGFGEPRLNLNPIPIPIPIPLYPLS
jgi:hypothetical protein